MTPSNSATDSRPELPAASGSHDVANYVTIFLAIHRQRQTGVLETGTRRGWRRLYFLEGEVVAFRSSFAQDGLGRTLASAGIVPKARIQWFEDRLGPDEHIESALLASGALTPAQLTDHAQGRIRHGIATPLRSSAGSWRFEPTPGLDPASIATGLRPEVASVEALWDGIRQHLAVDKVLPEVTDTDLGPLVATDALREVLPTMNLEPPLAFLGEAIGDSISVEELFKQIPDRSGNLLKLVWMLERGGLLGRKDRPIDTNLADRLTAVGVQADDPDVIATLLAWARRQLDQGQPEAPEPEAPEPTPTAAVQVGATPAAIRVQPGPASPSEGDDESVAHSVPPASSTSSVPPRSHGPLGDDDAPQIDIGNFASRGSRSTGNATGSPRSVSRRAEPTMTPARISREHTKRLERDFYGFLGIKVGAPSGVVDRRCKVLAKRWSAARELDLEDHTRRQLNQLLHGLQIVWQTLAHDDRKEEYDRRMKDGQPPKVDEIRRALEGAEGLQAHNQAEEQAELEAADGADVAMARRLISRGAFGAASRLLERLRRSEPSSPDVLAELGWAVWKLRGSSGGENDPEDFIALALTFAPRHIPALEYHARIAYERGDHDALQDRLDRLLSADRENSWAVRVLSGDTHSTPPSRRSGGGLRFWRRKSD